MRTPDRWDTARATVAIAVGTGLVHLILMVFELRGWAIVRGAFVPADLTTDFGFTRAPFALTPLTATLIHADFFHLVFNLLILLLCGRAVEGALGPANLIILYVVGAFAAAAAQFGLDPAAQVPMIGASGAISAVIGAYAMLFGKNRVPVRDPRLALWLNVLWLLAAWVVLQVAMGIVLSAGQGILLAVGAHVGGFVAGVALARPLLLWRYRKA
jgi:membrane associated rhomboid family serine protease